MKQHVEKFNSRPLSYSSINSFEYNKEDWFRSYILGIKTSSKEMEFGSYVDKRIQEDPNFYPDLPRYERMQHRMTGIPFAHLKLTGIPDGLNFKINKILADYKTGKNEWTIKRAKETGQLKFYLLLLWITERFNPEDFECRIHWLPTKENESFEIVFVEEGKFQTFVVRHKMSDILKFGQKILKVHKEMEEYCEKHL